jgi:adenylate kinase
LGRSEHNHGMAGMRIAVTGTPGTGKTTLCEASKLEMQSVIGLAERHGCLGPVDSDDGAAPVDVERLIEAVDWTPSAEMILIDGHLSHLLPVDAILLIRCHPSILQSRLEERGYSAAKVVANVESELIGIIAAECEDLPCLELDSASSTDSMIAALKRWAADGFKPHQPNAAIDWIEVIHGDD